MWTSSTATVSAQPGPQTEFLRTPADICIYGGAAGGGKTAGLILEPLRHAGRVAKFTAVFFRRTTPQITNPGGLWDESQNFPFPLEIKSGCRPDLPIAAQQPLALEQRQRQQPSEIFGVDLQQNRVVEHR